MSRLVFISLVSALFTTGAHAAGPAFECVMENRLKADDTMTMTFAATDIANGRGMVIGNAGTADVFVVQTPSAMHFLEVTAIGAMMVATVVLPEDGLQLTGPNDATRLSIIYSRHTILLPLLAGDGSNILPSQYVGQCTVKS